MRGTVSDSLETRKNYLVVAGFSELQANAVVDTLRGFREGLATQADIRELHDKMDGIDTRLDRVDTRLDGMASRLDGMATKQEVADLREVMATKLDIAKLTQKMVTKQDLADQREETRSQRMTDRWMFTVLWALMIATNGLLIHYMG